MNINQLIGQHILIGLSGPTLTIDEKNFIVENNISGVVLYDHNCIEPKQIRNLCAELQSLRSKTVSKAPFFIGINLEGGRINPLKPPFTQWPALKKIGDLDAPTAAFHLTQRMGTELLAIGINLNFAPCVDVFSNPKNEGISDRAVSSDPNQVEKMASALVRGYIKSGVMTCAKHFPGAGPAVIESPDKLPNVDADMAKLNASDLIPFKKTLRSRVDMVMTGHIMFKKIDPDWPVTMSTTFLSDLIRDELKYKGLVVTGDLEANALVKTYDKETIAVRSYQAGNDLLVYGRDLSSAALAIESLTGSIAQGQIQKSDLEQSYKRIADVKKIRIIRPDPIPLEEALQIIGCEDHQNLAKNISEGKMPAGLLEE